MVMKGFIRLQEEKVARKLLLWQYQKKGIMPPSGSDLDRRVCRLVDEAHRIGADRGRNVLSILKELVDASLKK